MDIELFQQTSPEKVLGLFQEKLIRFFIPNATEASLCIKGKTVQAKHLGKGLFAYESESKIGPLDYQIVYPFQTMHDPYVFESQIEEIDLHLFQLGMHDKLYKLLGAHLRTSNGIHGTQFALWAPNAKKVYLTGDFNDWDHDVFPMKQREGGIWELFLPTSLEGNRYKYVVHSQDGTVRMKTDPMGRFFEKRPRTASIVEKKSSIQWTDDMWLQSQEGACKRAMNIYEVHLGSWKKLNGDFPNYRDLVGEIISYCKKMHFTHVELLPIMEHPLDESWGYQITGFFAPTSRYGSLDDFRYFVNALHENQIGVILDWVPGHFPTDDFALIQFDGTYLYEYDHPLMQIHPHWSTAIFDYRSYRVTNFLIASALFWLDEMHVDGLRVDAVSSIIYLDFGRKKGEWTPNKLGTNLNLEGIEFLKLLNAMVKKNFSNKIMIAEESSAFVGVTVPPEKNGLGFDLKWKMGWMNDTLRYFSTDIAFRKLKQKDLTFSIDYAYDEKFVLALSHDEVVHEKRSLINKLDEADWIQFANLRLLYSYMICHPGRKLLFMGGEIGQKNEWNCKGEIDWSLLEDPMHQKMQHFVKELNCFYLQKEALWSRCFEEGGFEWIDATDEDESVLSYLRKGHKTALVCVHRFVSEEKTNYLIPLKSISAIQEVFNTDHGDFGGTNRLNSNIAIEEMGFRIVLPPMSTMIFEVNC